MPKTHAYDQIHALALEQHGVITAEQAEQIDVSRSALAKMVARGRLERQAHGLYQDNGAPETLWTPYMRAVLWPHGTVGVLSHETALSLMELSDANPARVHVTVPARHRTRRDPLPGVVLHRADLHRADIGSVAGLPVTRAARTIRDCAQAGLGPALVRQAIEDGERSGYLTKREAALLRRELRRDGHL